MFKQCFRDDIMLKGGTPKNHAQDNFKRLQKLAADNKAKKAIAEQPPAPLFKLKKFVDVPSKLHTQVTSGLIRKPESSRPSTASSQGSNVLYGITIEFC